MKYKLLLLPWTPDRPPGSNSTLYTVLPPRYLCNEPGYQKICHLEELLREFAYVHSKGVAQKLSSIFGGDS